MKRRDVLRILGLSAAALCTGVAVGGAESRPAGWRDWDRAPKPVEADAWMTHDHTACLLVRVHPDGRIERLAEIQTIAAPSRFVSEA